MTLRQAYEYALIESNKLKAPAMLLEDFIYLFNKAIQQKVNEIYNRFDINQQSSDDLRVLQTTAECIKTEGDYFELPEDYLHLLNCVAVFEGTSNKSVRCWMPETVKTVKYPCRRMTADLEAGIYNNYYLKPDVRRPYYFLITNAQDVDNTLDRMNDEQKAEEDQLPLYKESGDRQTNPTKVTLKLEYGESDRWVPKKIILTYLRSPRYVTMTEDDLWDRISDNTPVLEFPDYMCYEIINTYMKLLFENVSDPRLQTNMAVNQSIAIAGNK